MDEIKLPQCCGVPARLLYLAPLRAWAVECGKNGHIHNTGFCESKEEAVRVWQTMKKAKST